MKLSGYSVDPDFYIQAHGASRNRVSRWAKRSYFALLEIRGYPRRSLRSFSKSTEAEIYSQRLEKRARAYCTLRAAMLAQNKTSEEAI